MIADFAGRPRSFSSSSNGFVAIGRWASGMSDQRLVVAEAVGFGAAVLVLAWMPKSLEIALVATAIGSMGLWGVTDHMFEARRRFPAPLRWTLESFRFTIAAAGIAAAMLSGYAFMGRVMGVFIL